MNHSQSCSQADDVEAKKGGELPRTGNITNRSERTQLEPKKKTAISTQQMNCYGGHCQW